MENLELAKHILEEEDLSIVLIKDQKIIYKSKDKGIRPIYDIFKNYKTQAEGAALADRVIGRGAAILAKDLKIKSIYTPLISEPALEVLSGVGIFYDKKVDMILNRDKSGICPIEDLSRDVTDSKDLSQKLENFLGGVESE